MPPQPAAEAPIALFKGKVIRKTMFQKEWWFVIADVVTALTDTKQPLGYIKDLRRRDEELSKGWGQIATPLQTLSLDDINAMRYY